MRPNPGVDPIDPPSQPSIELVLREAKRLHRAARSDSLCAALPVLRRLLQADAVPRVSLPELFRRRTLVQRKHLLRALAVEAGHESWEQYRPVLSRTPATALQHFELVQPGAGHLNLWFPSASAARIFAAHSGGQALRVGRQGVVLAAEGAPPEASHA